METTDYCNYELSKALKACGFNELTNSFYDEASVRQGEFEIVPTYAKFNEVCRTPGCECVSAPLLYHAQKWLREKKGIAINVIAHNGGVYDYDIVFLPNAVDCDCPIDRATFSRTYEEALSEGITSVLELIKKARNLFRRNSDFF